MLAFLYPRDREAGGINTVELLTQQPAQIVAALIDSALSQVALAYGRH